MTKRRYFIVCGFKGYSFIATTNYPVAYATTFGYADSYCDYIQEIATERKNIAGLINLKISEADVADILREAGFAGYCYDGALNWIMKAMKMIRSL